MPVERRPVLSGTRRIPGLYERTRADGSTAFEVAARLGGKVRRHTLEARTKTDAIAEARALVVDYDRGEAHRSPAAALSVADLVDDYVRHLHARVGHRDPRMRYSTRTVELYEHRLRSLVVKALGPRPVASLTVADLRGLIATLDKAGASPSTTTGAMNIVSGLLRYAVRNGHALRNVARDLDRDDRPGAARQSEPRYLRADELAQLLAGMTDTFRPVAAVCAFAGLRVSEALGLRWRDLDLKAGTLTVSAQLGTTGERVPLKTAASAATVPLLPALRRELLEHRTRQAGIDLRRVHADALAFTTAQGRPQSRRNALRAVHAAGDTAGLNPEGREKVGLHDLRHSFVALGLDAGISLAEAAALARHASARVTAQVYAGITDDGREKASAKLLRVGFGA